MKRNIGVVLLFFLVFCFGCEFSDPFTEPEFITVEGTVRDTTGQVLSGVKVKVGDRKTITGQEGLFFLDSLKRGTVQIELHGDAGIGRYKVNLTNSVVPMVFEYPVVTTIILLHDNDQHFNFNFSDRFAKKVQDFRAEYDNVWLLNAGDIFVRHAHRWPVAFDTCYYARRSRYMIETMNTVGYDVMTPGNHEFDYVGSHTGESMRLTDFSIIAANVDVATTKLPMVDPYVILETKNGLEIAVLGLSVGPNKPGVTFRDILETAKNYRHLANENDLFVALTHIGRDRDQELAMLIPELDVIIGGHSHVLMENAEMVNGVLHAIAGGGTHLRDPTRPKWLGVISIEMENDKVAEKHGYVITIE